MEDLKLAAYKLTNQSTQLKPIVLQRNTGCSHKIFNIFKPLFIYGRTIHIFVHGSSTSAIVSATDTES